MVVKKMKQTKIKCGECDCWSLTYGIKKKIRRHKILIHTFTKRIEDKTDNNNNDKMIKNNQNTNKKQKQKTLNRRAQSKRGNKKHTSYLLTYGSTD